MNLTFVNDPRFVGLPEDKKKLVFNDVVKTMASSDVRFSSLDPVKQSLVLDDLWAVANPPSKTNVMGAVGDVGRGLLRVPGDVASSVASIFDDPMRSDGWADQFIEGRQAEQSTIDEAPGASEIAVPGTTVTRQEIRSGMGSLGYSGAAMAAGVAPRVAATVAGALLGSEVPLVGNLAGGVLGFMGSAAASGGASYRMDKNNFIRQYRRSLSKKEGRTITDEEFAALEPGKVADALREHGLWEAGPEGIANAIELGLMGKIFKGGGLTTKALKSFVGLVGFELGSEAVTQTGGKNVEVDLGMQPESERRSWTSMQDQLKSVREVAPAVLLMGGITGSGAYAAGKINSALSPAEAPAPPDLLSQIKTKLTDGAVTPEEVHALLPQILAAGVTADEVSSLLATHGYEGISTAKTTDEAIAAFQQSVGNPLAIKKHGEDLAAGFVADRERLAAQTAERERESIQRYGEGLMTDFAAQNENIAAATTSRNDQFSQNVQRIQGMAATPPLLPMPERGFTMADPAPATVIRKAPGSGVSPTEPYTAGVAQNPEVIIGRAFKTQAGAAESLRQRGVKGTLKADEYEVYPAPGGGYQIRTKKAGIPGVIEQKRTAESIKAEKEAVVRSNPLFAAVQSAKKRPLSLAALRQDYDADTVNMLLKKYPGMFSGKSKAAPDEFAIDNGFSGLDDMVEQLKASPSMAALRQKYETSEDQAGDRFSGVDEMVRKGFEPKIDSLGNPQNMVAGQLEKGDKVYGSIGDHPVDEYELKGTEDGNYIFQDGVRVEVDPFEPIRAQGVKKGEGTNIAGSDRAPVGDVGGQGAVVGPRGAAGQEPGGGGSARPAEQPGEGVAVKQPWEMTSAEWVGADQHGQSPYEKYIGSKQNLKWRAEDRAKAMAAHKWGIVKQALEEGKPVPPHVLAEYPDLFSTAVRLANAIGKPEQIATLNQMGVTGEAEQADHIVRDAVKQPMDIATALRTKGNHSKAAELEAKARANGDALKAADGLRTEQAVDAILKPQQEKTNEERNQEGLLKPEGPQTVQPTEQAPVAEVAPVQQEHPTGPAQADRKSEPVTTGAGLQTQSISDTKQEVQRGRTEEPDKPGRNVPPSGDIVPEAARVEPQASLTVTTRQRELENARDMLARDPENALKLALVQQAKERLDAVSKEEKPAAGVQEISGTAPYTLADHESLVKLLMKGEATVPQVQEAYSRVRASRPALEDELRKKTVAELKKLSSGYNRADNKAEYVRSVANDLETSFAYLNNSGMFSYSGIGPDARIKAIDAIVAGLTQANLDAYAEKFKARRAERAEMLEGVKNPKTLVDFRRMAELKRQGGKSNNDIFEELSSDQLAEWDRLEAEESRGKRAEKPPVVAASVTTTGEVIETKHTKTGEPLFVVKPAERVARDAYNAWNTAAKRMGGHYSSFRGAGAVPGFQFKTRAAAEAFQKFMTGDTEAATAAVEERGAAKEQTGAERLAAMADALEAKAQASLSQDRKANTSRRAAQAASAEASASADVALAKTMRNIAAAIKDGSAVFLDKVRAKVHIELLQKFLYDARYAEYPQYSDYEKHRYDPYTNETVDKAEFPKYTTFTSTWARIGRELSAIDGSKLIGERLLKVANDVTDEYKAFAKDHLAQLSSFTASGKPPVFPTQKAAEAAIARSGYKGKAVSFQEGRGKHRVIMGPELAKERGIWPGAEDKRITLRADFVEEILGKMKEPQWYLKSVQENRARLAAMGIESPAELRSALREFIALNEAAERPSKVKQLERAMVGRRNDSLDFFPTPAGTVQTMLDAAGIRLGMTVLEPSAGMGHIAEQIREAGVEPDVAEMASDRRELLDAKGFNVVGQDFMDVGKTGTSPLQEELDALLKKRDSIREKQMARFHNGSATRARTTTGNADADRVNEQIISLREQIKSEDKVVPSQYDRIVMNPPFSNRRDAEHVQHAYTLLKPGGKIVALMGEGVFFGQDKKAVAFREWLESVGGTSEKLEGDTFQDPSLPVTTGANARMVVIDKSGGSEKSKPAESLFSKSTTPSTNRTVAQVTAESREYLGVGHDNMVKAGKLVVVVDESGLPDGVRQDGLFMTAWHGSPHRFDKFSTEKIGTGEGAQAYGHGLYMASSRAVAEFYRKSLTDNRPNFNGRDVVFSGTKASLDNAAASIIDRMYEDGESFESAKENEIKKLLSFRAWGEKNNPGKVNAAYFDAMVEYLSQIQKDQISIEIGALYEVELEPKEDEYLLWDKPLSEQSENVRFALAANSDFAQGEISQTHRGSYLYRYIADGLDSDKAASEYLHSLGIRGIKYLDGTSRGKGEGNYNYVIFSDDDISIKALYSRSGSVVGAYHNGKIYLVADRLRAGDTRYVLAHEAIHLLSREDSGFMKLFGKIKADFEAARATDKSVQAAFARVPANTPAEVRTEEAIGYHSQEPSNHTSPWYRRLWTAIKLWMRRVGLPVGRFTPDEIIAAVTGRFKRFAENVGAEERAAMGDAVAAFSKQFGITVAEAQSQYDAVVEKFKDIKAGTKLGSGWVFHNTKSKDLELIKKEGLGGGSFVEKPGFDFGGDVWLAVRESDLRNVQRGQYGAMVSLEPQWGPGIGGDGFHEIPASRVYRVDKKGRVISRLGDSQWMKAPNGQPTKLNERQWVQTRTEAFKEWFGDSRVVDANGEPLVMYHGTQADFNEFSDDYSGSGTLGADTEGTFFFTSKPGVADDFAGRSVGASVYPVFLKVENPTVWDMSGGAYREGFLKETISEAKKEGSDSVVFTHMADGSISTVGPWKVSHIVAIFSPDQIKSAIGNTGQFSPFTDDIRYSKAEIAAAAKAPLFSKESDPILAALLAGDIAGAARLNSTAEYHEATGATPRPMGILQNAPELYEQVGTYLWDKDIAIERVQREVGPQPVTRDYALLRGLVGTKTASEIEVFDRDVLKPLLKFLADNKITIPDLERLAWAQHAPERNLQMRRVNARQYIDALVAQMTEKEQGPYAKRLFDVNTEFVMDQQTLNERRDNYVGMMDEISEKEIRTQRQQAAEIDADQDALDVRDDIEDKTRQYHQDRIDNKRDRLAARVKVAEKWNDVKGRLSGMTDEQAAEVVASHKAGSPIFEATRRLRAINEQALETNFEAGEITEDEYRAISGTYEFHVPLYREDMEDNRQPTGKPGTGPLASPIKMASGSTKGVVDIFAHVIDRYQAAISRKYNLEAGRALYEMVKENPDESKWSIVEREKKPYRDKEGNVRYYQDMSLSLSENETKVKVDGKVYIVSVPKDNKPMLRWMAAINYKANDLGPITRASRYAVRIMAALNTVAAPEFLMSNFIKDLQTATIHLTATEAKNMKWAIVKSLPTVIRGIYQAEHGDYSSEMAQWHRDYSEHGGKISWRSGYENVQELAKELQKELETQEGKHPARATWRKYTEIIGKASISVENGVRLATYKALVEAGVEKNKAAQTAKGLTVDFTKHGTVGPFLNSIVMFANAGIQGNVTMIKNLVKSPTVRKIAGGIVGLGALTNVLGVMMGGDDDDGESYYDKLKHEKPSLFERNMIFMIPGSKGDYFKIPMPYGYNVFFVLGNEMASAWRGNDKTEAAVNFATALAGTFNPIQAATVAQTFTPTLMRPVVQVAENKAWHGGDLMPATNPFDPKPDSERYFKSVNPIIKAGVQGLNRLTGGDKFEKGAIDVSPETVEMLVETVTGSAGRFAKDIFSLPVAMFSENGLPAEKTPFIRKMYGANSSYGDSKLYREKSEKVELLLKRFKDADPAGKREIIRDPLYRLAGAYRQTDKQVSLLNKTLKLAQKKNDKAREERIAQKIAEVKKKYVTEYNKLSR